MCRRHRYRCAVLRTGARAACHMVAYKCAYKETINYFIFILSICVVYGVRAETPAAAVAAAAVEQ